MGKKFINVVVQLIDTKVSTLSFVRIKIPMKIVNELLEEMRRDSRIYYVRHQHGHGHGRDAYSLDPTVNGPFSTNLPKRSLSAAIGSVVYCFVPDCPTYLLCDFSQPLPNWKPAQPFPSRFDISPSGMVTLDGKLYVFGFNDSLEAKSGKIFDPTDGCWEDLSFPIIDKSNQDGFVVASAGQKILLFDMEKWVLSEYDPQLLRWTSGDYEGLLGHFTRNMRKPITVEEETTIYWIDHQVKIRAYDWGHSKLYVGSIIGLAHEPMIRSGSGFAVPLFHLKKQLFCIIWLDECGSLHITVLRVSRDASRESSSDSVHRLYVAVVDCFHYPLNSLFIVDDAYKL